MAQLQGKTHVARSHMLHVRKLVISALESFFASGLPTRQHLLSLLVHLKHKIAIQGTSCMLLIIIYLFCRYDDNTAGNVPAVA